MRGPGSPLGHPRRDGVGQLFTSHTEQLLTHELGDPERLGHISDHVVGVIGRSFGQPRHEMLDERIDSRSRLPRHREVLAEIELRRLRELFEHLRRLRDVGLVHDDDRITRHSLGDEPIASPQRHRGVDHQAHEIDSAQRVGRGRVEARAESTHRLVDAGRVDEHDLHVRPREHPSYLRPRRLRFVGDDRDLRAENVVEQRRLPDVGPPDQRHEPRSEAHSEELTARLRPRRAPNRDPRSPSRPRPGGRRPLRP